MLRAGPRAAALVALLVLLGSYGRAGAQQDPAEDLLRPGGDLAGSEGLGLQLGDPEPGETPVAAEPAPAIDPATEAYAGVFAQMQQALAAPFVGNADADFARSMVPFYQSSIEAAQIALHYGQDPDLKAIAQSVITTQEEKLEALRDWIAKHPL